MDQSLRRCRVQLGPVKRSWTYVDYFQAFQQGRMTYFDGITVEGVNVPATIGSYKIGVRCTCASELTAVQRVAAALVGLRCEVASNADAKLLAQMAKGEDLYVWSKLEYGKRARYRG